MSISRSTKAGLSGIVVASAALLAMLSIDEGTRYKPYRDGGGVWTVCQGHTANVDPSRTYTKEECRNFLEDDTLRHGAAVLACVTRPMTQNQYDAFTRFTFNVGPRAFCKSTMARKFNAGDTAGACAELLRWVYVKGDKEPNRGLLNRRKREYSQCMGHSHA